MHDAVYRGRKYTTSSWALIWSHHLVLKGSDTVVFVKAYKMFKSFRSVVGPRSWAKTLHCCTYWKRICAMCLSCHAITMKLNQRKYVFFLHRFALPPKGLRAKGNHAYHQTCIPFNSTELIDLNRLFFSAKLNWFSSLFKWVGWWLRQFAFIK